MSSVKFPLDIHWNPVSPLWPPLEPTGNCNAPAGCLDFNMRASDLQQLLKFKFDVFSAFTCMPAWLFCWTLTPIGGFAISILKCSTKNSTQWLSLRLSTGQCFAKLFVDLIVAWVARLCLSRLLCTGTCSECFWVQFFVPCLALPQGAASYRYRHRSSTLKIWSYRSICQGAQNDLPVIRTSWGSLDSLNSPDRDRGKKGCKRWTSKKNKCNWSSDKLS